MDNKLIVDITGLNRYHENLKNNVLTTKQDVISDLETIRTGAAAGAAASADATSKANAAESAAKTYADGLVKDADGNVKFDAVGAAAAAQAAAEATASADATSKANAAQSAAEATASADATSKANAAESAAKTYADGLVKDGEGKVKFDAVGSAAAAQAAAEQKATDLNTAMGERVAKLEAIDHEKLVLDASATAVAAIVAGAESDFDTLKEVADWINSDTTGAAALQIKVSENADAITGLTNDKQNVISDLETIRSGAAAGATALQENDLQFATDGDIDGLFA